MPVRVLSLEKKSADVMVVKLQLPANEVTQYRAGQYVDFLLRDGDAASAPLFSTAASLPAGAPPPASCSLRWPSRTAMRGFSAT